MKKITFFKKKLFFSNSFKMKFLKHDINKGLLALVIFFLVIFIVITVYYENNIKSILDNQQQTNQKISEITAGLILETLNKSDILETLNKSDKLKEIALIDKAVLEEKYSDVLGQYEILKKEKLALTEEVNLLKSELEYQKFKLEGPVEQFRLIQDKNKIIRQLKEKIDATCFLLKYKNVSTNECD